MKNIKTNRLLLRPLKIEDIDSVMNFWGNEEVMKYCGGPGTKERELKALKYYINLQNKKGYSPFVLELKENKNIIGVCGFNPTNKEDEIELIYHLNKNYWKKGYAFEAASACINYARKNLNIKRILASVDPRNIASRKILEKLGFKFKESKFKEVTKQEEYHFELII